MKIFSRFFFQKLFSRDFLTFFPKYSLISLKSRRSISSNFLKSRRSISSNFLKSRRSISPNSMDYKVLNSHISTNPAKLKKTCYEQKCYLVFSFCRLIDAAPLEIKKINGMPLYIMKNTAIPLNKLR